MRDFDKLSNEQLYKQAKAGRDLLMKRRKRLQAAYDASPSEISPFALQKLNEGIPMVSTSMGRNQLKAALNRVDDLRQMRTSTVKGARQYQTEMVRTLLNLPTTGKLNETDKQELETFKDTLRTEAENGRDLVSEFWQGYDYFKQNVAYKGYDTQRTLNEYQRTYNDVNRSGAMSLDALRGAIRQVTTREYEEQAQKDNIFNFSTKGGMFK